MVLRRQVMRSVVIAVAFVVSTGVSSPGAVASERVLPNQHFVGMINGRRDKAVVHVVCPGPGLWAGRTGRPTGNQTLEVLKSTSGGGYTGRAGSRVSARFLDDPAVEVQFTTFGSKALPAKELSLPCEGDGFVEFAPSHTSATAVSDLVKVTYVNIAV
ncbi:MAG TPA: hypothetical protein VM121_11675 [Acidimicrobiales bacterium]|nr:hypothetical protein [Acidimicrobiales bacterium]